MIESTMFDFKQFLKILWELKKEHSDNPKEGNRSALFLFYTDNRLYIDINDNIIKFRE